MIKSWFSASPDIVFNSFGDISFTHDKITKETLIRTAYTTSFTKILEYTAPAIKVQVSNYADEQAVTAAAAVVAAAAVAIEKTTEDNNTSTVQSPTISTSNRNNNTDLQSGYTFDDLEFIHRDDLCSCSGIVPEYLFSLEDLLEEEILHNTSETTLTPQSDKSDGANILSADTITESVVSTVPVMFSKNFQYKYSGTFTIHLNEENKITRFTFFFKLLSVEKCHNTTPNYEEYCDNDTGSD